METPELVNASDAKVKLFELLKDVAEQDVLILNRGKPQAMIIAYETYLKLIARLEDLEDQLSIYEAREETADMRVPWEKVQAEVGLP